VGVAVLFFALLPPPVAAVTLLRRRRPSGEVWLILLATTAALLALFVPLFPDGGSTMRYWSISYLTAALVSVIGICMPAGRKKPAAHVYACWPRFGADRLSLAIT